MKQENTLFRIFRAVYILLFLLTISQAIGLSKNSQSYAEDHTWPDNTGAHGVYVAFGNQANFSFRSENRVSWFWIVGYGDSSAYDISCTIDGSPVEFELQDVLNVYENLIGTRISVSVRFTNIDISYKINNLADNAVWVYAIEERGGFGIRGIIGNGEIYWQE